MDGAAGLHGHGGWTIAVSAHVGLSYILYFRVIYRRKGQWYGHVSRSSGLAKTILQVTVKGEGGGEEETADRGRGGKTTSGNGQPGVR